MADSLARGEAPFASHALYTLPGVLDDDVPEERRRGMEAGFAWGEAADQVAVYVDLGVSRGMLEGCERAAAAGLPREARRVEGWSDGLPEHLAAFFDGLPERARSRGARLRHESLTIDPATAWRLAGLLDDRDPPPWADLDPGIVSAVRLLWESDFDPTDSGDGSKAATMGCAMPFPHVFCRVPAPSLHREALRAAALDWESIGMPVPRVEGSLSPGEPAVVMVMWPGDLHGLPADAGPAAPLDEALAAVNQAAEAYARWLRDEGCDATPTGQAGALAFRNLQRRLAEMAADHTLNRPTGLETT
jgi:hypothetical protein